VSKLTTDVVMYCTEVSNQKSKYAYLKILFYKKSTACYCDVWYAKNVCIELAALLLYHRKKHCKKLPLP